MTLSPQDLGRRIIEINRAVRLGPTTPDEWAARVVSLMRAQPDLAEPIEVRNVRPLEGGAGSSSGTLFFEARHSDAEADYEQYVLRFRPAEQLFHVYDLDGQVRIQRALGGVGVPVPEQCWEDSKGTHLGVPGYVMRRAVGVAAPGAWFAEGIIADASPQRRTALIQSFLSTLAQIHAVDWRQIGLSFLLDRATGTGLIEQEINWYCDAMKWAGEDQALTRFAAVADWLIANQPPVERPVLCHGDANFTNYLFDSSGVTSVLDWEMAFIGLPEADIAYATVGMSSLTTEFPEGVPSETEMIAFYENLTGRPLLHLPYYRLFALYRIVLIFTLGMRAFPPDFKAHFSAFAERTVDRMTSAAEKLGAL